MAESFGEKNLIMYFPWKIPVRKHSQETENGRDTAKESQGTGNERDTDKESQETGNGRDTAKESQGTGNGRDTAKESQGTGNGRETAKESQETGNGRDTAKESQGTGNGRDTAKESQETGKGRDTAKESQETENERDISPISSSSDESSGDSVLEDLVQTWMSETKMYLQDQILDMQLEIRRQLKDGEQKNYQRYYMKNMCKIHPQSNNTVQYEMKIQHVKATPINTRIPDQLPFNFDESSAVRDTNTTSPPLDMPPLSNCKSLSDILDHVSQHGCQVSEDFNWTRLRLCFEHLITITARSSENLRQMEKSLIESFNELVASLKSRVEFFERDLNFINERIPRTRQEIMQFNHLLHSLHRMIWDFYPVLKDDVKALVDNLESYYQLKNYILQDVHNFLNSDL